MKTKYFFLAAFAATFASCANEEYIGDNSPNAALEQTGDGSIQFGFDMQNATRADIVGSGAATLLGNNFYVTGTKGSETETKLSPTLVFDNYLVHYGANTAGTTESNTANWEYVGIVPGTTSGCENHVKLSALNSQTIKYWDYSVAQYDFFGFSTGTKHAVSKTEFSGGSALTEDEIGVTAMNYGGGTGLASGATAYTFYIPTTAGLQNTYITDVIKVAQGNYGKEVKLTFKNLGSKIRFALYETVPGYSVKDVQFYTVDKADDTVDDLGDKPTTAALISADGTNGFSTQGTAVVSFPKLGTNNADDGNYRKASVNVTPVAPVTPTKYQQFGTLDYKKDKEGDEDAGTIYLGRNITEATFAGNSAVGYYQVVFPVTTSSALTLRVNYTLVSTDGSGETIRVYGAKAVVPSTYTVWQPNYAYTYIFKITDNTNGWTDTGHTKAGLFPITFDAVVAEIKDVSGEQRTVTTVSTPTITTYQQSHDKSKDEYSKTATGPSATPTVKNLYIQVMDNTASPATLKTDLADNATGASTKKSLLYAVTLDPSAKVAVSEATVMDALQNQSSVAAGVITGRNGVILTPAALDLAQTTIVNGVDDKVINLESTGKVAMINMTSTPAGNYAYVYDYSDAAKTTKTFYQPNGYTGAVATGVKYIRKSDLDAIAYDSNKTSGSEAADDAYIYFSKTTTDGVNYTYSYYSVDGKEGNLPEGLLKVSKSSLQTGDGSASATASDFVFDIYTRNSGAYAVKVIKIVD